MIVYNQSSKLKKDARLQFWGRKYNGAQLPVKSEVTCRWLKSFPI